MKMNIFLNMWCENRIVLAIHSRIQKKVDNPHIPVLTCLELGVISLISWL